MLSKGKVGHVIQSAWPDFNEAQQTREPADAVAGSVRVYKVLESGKLIINIDESVLRYSD
jgi:hypothetical protein